MYVNGVLGNGCKVCCVGGVLPFQLIISAHWSVILDTSTPRLVNHFQANMRWLYVSTMDALLSRDLFKDIKSLIHGSLYIELGSLSGLYKNKGNLL
jgi:hypothetical protein